MVGFVTWPPQYFCELSFSTKTKLLNLLLAWIEVSDVCDYEANKAELKIMVYVIRRSF